MMENFIDDLIVEAEYDGDDEIEKLKAEIAELKLWNEYLIASKNDHTGLFKYLAEESIGDCRNFVEAINDVASWNVLGYVTVTKKIGDKGKLLLDFDVPTDNPQYGVDHKTAEWDASQNMGVFATRCFEDDWHGYFLFPTHDESKYLCVWYSE